MLQEASRHFPQVLLLGNGLNRAFGGENWSKAIESIWKNKAVLHADVKGVPFPLQTVIGTEDKVEEVLKRKPQFMYGLENLDEIKTPLSRLLTLNFDHILTTNYSYEIERVMIPTIDCGGNACARFLAHTGDCKRAESKHLIHAYNQIDYCGHTNRVWHIHGEARKPSSVVIGHYNYGKLLDQYIKELDDRKNIQYERQQSGKAPAISSWLDVFIMGDVYVLRFGFDFSEFDLWWRLNRKKREKAECGRTVLYEPSYGNEVKHALLDTYGVEVKSLGFHAKNCKLQLFGVLLCGN